MLQQLAEPLLVKFYEHVQLKIMTRSEKANACLINKSTQNDDNYYTNCKNAKIDKNNNQMTTTAVNKRQQIKHK